MVPLTTAATGFEARVIAAHLGAEGIVWELRGNVDGPYPVGPVVVMVAEAELATAREVVAGSAAPGTDPTGIPEAEAEAPIVGPGAGDAPSEAARRHRSLWLPLIAALVVTATLLGRLLVLSWR
ncbi:MAG TPA: hypothetical protein VFW63_08375 [Acidimicrobiales bacterium]|nr:hypothetical protein [Acidimicrobiales bacterium]